MGRLLPVGVNVNTTLLNSFLTASDLWRAEVSYAIASRAACQSMIDCTSSCSVTFTISASSNLTDSGANTAQGQSSVAVTNGSTKAATTLSSASSSTSISAVGIDHNATASAGGKTYATAVPSSRWEFTYTGTDLDMMVWSTSGTTVASVTVDGVTTTPTLVITNGWTRMPVVSGASNSAHTVVITRTNAFVFATAGTFTGFGTGSFSLPTGYSKSYPLKSVGNFMAVESPLTRGNNFDGSPCANGGGTDYTIGFRTTGGASNHLYRLSMVNAAGNPALLSEMMLRSDGSLWLYLNKGGGRFVMQMDGVEQNTLSSTLPSDGTWGWVQVFSGLDASAIDESQSLATRPSAFFGGDSITNTVSNGGTGDSRIGHPHQVGLVLNTSVGNGGTPGAVTPSICPLTSTAQAPTFVVLSSPRSEGHRRL